MPGLIDAHTHIMFATLPQAAILTADVGFVNVAAVKAANEMLQRGFTSIRDLGGPVFGLKRGIDAGLVAGPRIWPAGAMISQTGGHGDFRLPNEMPASPDQFTYAGRIGAAEIADGTDTLFSPAASAKQGAQLSQMLRWYTPAETLRMATSGNAELLALSGPRNPYPGKLGVVQEGALADLLLVDGNPLANIKLIEDPAREFLVIVKDGKIHKNVVR